MNSCKTDEAAAPAASAVTVSTNKGLLGLTKFNFTVTEVKANAVTLYPYGLANAAWGTVSITSFTGGSAVISDFKYDHVGTFDVVVVTNNNTTDPNGKVSVKNTVSGSTSVTITNNKAKFSKFVIEKSISRKAPLDTTARTVRDTVPFGVDYTKLTSSFTVDGFAVVTVGGVTQTSEDTKNNFTNPVTYNVKAQDGVASTNYDVRLYVIPVEKNTDIKSLSGAVTSVNSYGPLPAKKQRLAGGYADNTNKKAVFYLPYGSPADYDSIEVNYATSGKYSVLKYGTDKGAMKQGRRLDLSTSKSLVVFPQDSAGTTPKATYATYVTIAPKITVSFDGLLPKVPATTDDYSFNISTNVITQTDVTNLVPSVTETLPGAVGTVIITSYTTLSTADNSVEKAFVPGVTPVDFTKPVKFILHVHDSNVGGGIDYQVVYTVTVTKVP